MKREVLSAANFLVDMLRTASAQLSEEQLMKFKESVCECLWNYYQDHWFPDKPLKGSGYRCIRINGTLDPLIVRAGKLMGLVGTTFRMMFPSELTMWVDPWEVCYRIGENGSICVLYGKPCESTITLKEPTTPVKQQQSVITPDTPPTTPLSSSPAQKTFIPSRTPPMAIHYLQQHSPPPSPVSTNNALHQLSYQQQQQLAMFLMGHSTNNCKDSFRSSALDSMRGLERLFVSS